MPEAALHEQGFFVVEKLLETAAPADLLPLAAKLFPQGPRLTAAGHGPGSGKSNKLMLKLVNTMVRGPPSSKQSSLAPCTGNDLMIKLVNAMVCGPPPPQSRAPSLAPCTGHTLPLKHCMHAARLSACRCCVSSRGCCAQ